MSIAGLEQNKKKWAIIRVHVIDNRCFHGKGALGSLDSNNKKTRIFN